MGGASYLKSIKAPLPQVEMIPTGGVSLDTARSFLDAGAFALGVGADLVDAAAMAQGRAHEITSKAARYLDIVRRFRSEG
jgi:2-dehydro-3-deoxyphosphogluconate aldolase/(4S)-4-hydroxy-2-oxoglutarate aldolase